MELQHVEFVRGRRFITEPCGSMFDGRSSPALQHGHVSDDRNAPRDAESVAGAVQAQRRVGESVGTNGADFSVVLYSGVGTALAALDRYHHFPTGVQRFFFYVDTEQPLAANTEYYVTNPPSVNRYVAKSSQTTYATVTRIRRAAIGRPEAVTLCHAAAIGLQLHRVCFRVESFMTKVLAVGVGSPATVVLQVGTEKRLIAWTNSLLPRSSKAQRAA